jgi:predicted nucleic acid-binding protein
MPSQSFYIDASMLLFYFDRSSDNGRIARETIKKILANLDNLDIHVRIPQVVLGELFIFYCNPNNHDCDPSRMITLTKKLQADYPSANAYTLRLAQELMANDHSIKPNDSVLVAHALLDKATQWLFTTDQALISNLEIERQMCALGNRFTTDSKFHLV